MTLRLGSGVRVRLARVGIVVMAAATVGAACSGGDRPSLGAKTEGHDATPTTVPEHFSLIAQPRQDVVEVYAAPDSSGTAQRFANPWLLNDNPDHAVPQVFLVQERRGDWIRVLLPVRPNGSTGWVRSGDVRVTPNPNRIVVELGAHRITVFNGDDVVIQEPVATGADQTPTPTGKYYLRVLLKAPDPNTVYGPYAYGLSGHSEVLTEFNGGDAELGIHGNNDASVLGKSVTHGCIRISNDSITRLAGRLPLGTPVEILP